MEKSNGHQSNTSKRAEELLRDGKKLANALYEDGMHKFTEAEDNLKEYSDELLKKVQENPLAAMLISVGVGFVLSKLLSKK